MTKDEALKLALEALHGFIPYLPLNDEAQCGRYDKAITAIKEALAQPEQEPVGWYDSISGQMDFTFYKPHRKPSSPSAEWIPVYSRPSPPQRTWVGLTDDERIDLMYESGGNEIVAIQITEAKLKEKNT